jgi:hypothetical protein
MHITAVFLFYYNFCSITIIKFFAMFDSVNITGFQSFGSVKVNPTELIIN